MRASEVLRVRTARTRVSALSKPARSTLPRPHGPDACVTFDDPLADYLRVSSTVGGASTDRSRPYSSAITQDKAKQRG
jgi:hypothetical protein